MLRVGLTGGAGSGKSVVAGMLLRRGFPVIDADRVAHGLYVPGSDVVANLVHVFGSGILDSGGGIDRKKLGRMVFESPELLLALNDIVHPPLVRELEKILDRLEGEGETVAVLEAALLLQWGPPDFVNIVVGVIASPEIRKERLVRRGLTPEDADLRLAAQADLEDLTQRVDVLIDNSGNLAALEAEVDDLAKILRRNAPSGDSGA